MLLSDNIPADVYESYAVVDYISRDNRLLFASWLCHQKVFQMQVNHLVDQSTELYLQWELLSCLGNNWIRDIEN